MSLASSAARQLAPLLLLIGTAPLVTNALGYPDGAPWGADDPDSAENCASCHVEFEPALDSTAVSILLLESAAGYELEVRFDEPDAAIVGFMMSATWEDQDAGTFVGEEPGLETGGTGGIRSIEPYPNGRPVIWRIRWRAPTEAGRLPETGSVVFRVAVVAANDDASPFGDRVHFRTLPAPLGEDPVSGAAGGPPVQRSR